MSFRYRIFRALAQVSIKRPYLVLLCAVALSIASVFYTKARLEFHTGQDDLITPNSRASRDYLDYTHEFPDLDGLIVVVRAAPDPARAEHFADTLAARLNADHANVKTVFYKIDAGAFADRAMLYMTSTDLDALAQKLSHRLPDARRIRGGPEPGRLLRDGQCGNRPPDTESDACADARPDAEPNVRFDACSRDACALDASRGRDAPSGHSARRVSRIIGAFPGCRTCRV